MAQQIDNSIPRLSTVRSEVDPRGRLTVIEALPDTGFVFKRLYFLSETQSGVSRGHHAHKNLWQYMVAMSGAFRITLKGRDVVHEFHLQSPGQGLLIPPGYWRELCDFSPDAVCMVAASEEYDETDYIRDYTDFIAWEKNNA